MTQLESMKYLSPELLGEITGNPVPPSKPESGPDPESVTEESHQPLASAADLGMPEWTITLTVVLGLMTLMGAWGAIGGFIELVGLASLETDVALAEKMGGYGVDVRANQAMLAAQIDNRLFLYLICAIRILVGIGFLGAASMMKTKQPAANRLAALVCLGGIFYSLLSVLAVYLCLPSTVPGVAADTLNTIGLVAMAFAVVAFAIKTGIYAALIAYLMNKSNRRLFAARPATESLG